MKSDMTDEKFVEILEANEFREKFNLSSVTNLNSISKSTLDFLKKDSKYPNSGLKSLDSLLKVYGITVQSYFNFLQGVNGMEFIDKYYRNFCCEEYKKLFEDLDNYTISDIEKLRYRIELLDKAEKNRRRDDTINIIGKTATIATGTIVAGVVGSKLIKEGKEIAQMAFDTKIKIAKITTTEKCVESVCSTISKGIEVVGKLIK